MTGAQETVAAPSAAAHRQPPLTPSCCCSSSLLLVMYCRKVDLPALMLPSTHSVSGVVVTRPPRLSGTYSPSNSCSLLYRSWSNLAVMCFTMR